ncbi:dTDP-4-dehydrorhamnose reductase [Chlorobium sp. N1]|uniref:dTDP-4-dehydrorhamnose reductase n=1 Tax=Chlorobium sp. N1 TaxID=2491138 RepID=UPI00103ADE14|nr:dTDP-4-dehydrorhamnose reductase [Chlorobium sp. N1]TCD47588.1 dTDP-4-dehydrorhamnose reductase [Chlorobium sp. N1]
MNILVTGAGGQLGRELRSLSGGFGAHRFLFLDRTALDIADPAGVRASFDGFRPDVVVNAAAYTAVDRAEDEPEAAMRVNRDGAGVLAGCCRDAGAFLIHVSTDYVFDGRASRPYRETDATGPEGVYGNSKLEGERRIGEADPSHAIIRTSWLYSAGGGNFVSTMLRLGRERETLGVVFDQAGTPTLAADLAAAIMHIALRHDPKFHYRGIWHYSNEGVASWYDFAHAVMELGGLACRVEPVTSAEFPQKAARPAYSVLDKSAIKKDWDIRIPHWRDSLRTLFSTNHPC